MRLHGVAPSSEFEAQASLHLPTSDGGGTAFLKRRSFRVAMSKSMEICLQRSTVSDQVPTLRHPALWSKQQLPHQGASAAFCTGVAPSRISWLHPFDLGSSGDPGTAIISLPRVINDPDLAAASITTTVPVAMPPRWVAASIPRAMPDTIT